MYAASVSKELAELRVRRMNNPNGFSNDENCITVGMARAKEKKARQEEKASKKK